MVCTGFCDAAKGRGMLTLLPGALRGADETIP